MKDNKDIIIDGLMARIRELEQQISYAERASNLAKGTRTKTLSDDNYIETACVDDIFHKNIDELYDSIRIRNCLRSENIRTVGQLVCFTADDILRTPNLAKKSVTEIQDKLKEHGLWLGMTEQDKINYQ